jgi:hypothetical protein
VLPTSILAGCSTPRTTLPSRVTLSLIATERNSAHADLQGPRMVWEVPADRDWTVYGAGTWVHAGDYNFAAAGDPQFDVLATASAGARRWWPVGPFFLGLGAEIGWGGWSGNGSDLESRDRGENDHVMPEHWAIAGGPLLRYDIPFDGAGALSLEAELLYRKQFITDDFPSENGVRPRDVYDSWVLFLGFGWAW